MLAAAWPPPGSARQPSTVLRKGISFICLSLRRPNDAQRHPRPSKLPARGLPHREQCVYLARPCPGLATGWQYAHFVTGRAGECGARVRLMERWHCPPAPPLDPRRGPHGRRRRFDQPGCRRRGVRNGPGRRAVGPSAPKRYRCWLTGSARTASKEVRELA